jgi:hypothetical protein
MLLLPLLLLMMTISMVMMMMMMLVMTTTTMMMMVTIMVPAGAAAELRLERDGEPGGPLPARHRHQRVGWILRHDAHRTEHAGRSLPAIPRSLSGIVGIYLWTTWLVMANLAGHFPLGTDTSQTSGFFDMTPTAQSTGRSLSAIHASPIGYYGPPHAVLLLGTFADPFPTPVPSSRPHRIVAVVVVIELILLIYLCPSSPRSAS